jgi:hypothetical protein
MSSNGSYKHNNKPPNHTKGLEFLIRWATAIFPRKTKGHQAEWSLILLRILVVLGSNLGPEADYPEWVLWFSSVQSLQSSVWVVPSNRRTAFFHILSNLWIIISVDTVHQGFSTGVPRDVARGSAQKGIDNYYIYNLLITLTYREL